MKNNYFNESGRYPPCGAPDSRHTEYTTGLREGVIPSAGTDRRLTHVHVLAITFAFRMLRPVACPLRYRHGHTLPVTRPEQLQLH